MKWIDLDLASAALPSSRRAAWRKGRRACRPTLVPPALAPASAVAAASPVAPARRHALTKADVDAWLDGYLPYALQAGDIAGASVAVVKDGQILTARGFGYSDVAKRKPVDPARTLFRPGSVSKLVTWTAVMQLVDEGKLDLDRDVNAYLDFKIPPYDGKPVTLRQLMTHTAGFEEAAKDLIAYDQKHNDAAGRLSQALHAEADLRARDDPGLFELGNLARRLYRRARVGHAVRRLSRAAHFRAAGHEQQSASASRCRTRLQAQCGARLSARVGESRRRSRSSCPAPAGSMSSTGDRHGALHARAPAGRRRRQILSQRAWQTMHNSPLTVVPPLNRMQLGFFETNVNGRRVNAHLGDTMGFHTSLHLFMDDGVGLYVSFNSGGKEGAVGDAARHAVPGFRRSLSSRQHA